MRESDLDFLVEQLSPEMSDLERRVRAADPTVEDADVLDRALQQGLADLHRELNRQTFDYLKAKLEALREHVERSKAEAQAVRFASIEARRQRAARRAAWGLNWIDSQSLLNPHSFRDKEDNCWTVQEVDTSKVSWARRPSCLIFSSELAIRRVWDFPADWRKLGNGELERLSWGK